MGLASNFAGMEGYAEAGVSLFSRHLCIRVQFVPTVLSRASDHQDRPKKSFIENGGLEISI
jgi:hypothetical protein